EGGEPEQSWYRVFLGDQLHVIEWRSDVDELAPANLRRHRGRALRNLGERRHADPLDPWLAPPECVAGDEDEVVVTRRGAKQPALERRPAAVQGIDQDDVVKFVVLEPGNDGLVGGAVA